MWRIAPMSVKIRCDFHLISPLCLKGCNEGAKAIHIDRQNARKEVQGLNPLERRALPKVPFDGECRN